MCQKCEEWAKYPYWKIHNLRTHGMIITGTLAIITIAAFITTLVIDADWKLALVAVLLSSTLFLHYFNLPSEPRNGRYRIVRKHNKFCIEQLTHKGWMHPIDPCDTHEQAMHELVVLDKKGIDDIQDPPEKIKKLHEMMWQL